MSVSESKSREILVLDDDPVVLAALRETLERERYNVHAFNSAKSALAGLEERAYATIISDQRMPEMTGLEFLDKCKQIQPNASRILITGVLTLNTVIEAVNRGEIFRFLAKPWIREEVLATVDNAVQRYALVEANERLSIDTLELNDKLVKSNSELEDKIQQLELQARDLEASNQVLEENFVLLRVRFAVVDLINLKQCEVALSVLRWTNLPCDAIAGAQIETTNLARGDVDIVGPGQIGRVRGAKESEAVLKNLQRAISVDVFAVLCVLTQNGSDDFLFARPSEVF